MTQHKAKFGAMHAASQIETHIKKNRDPYFKSMIKKSLGSFILFDNTNQSYFGNLRPLSLVERNDLSYKNNHRIYFTIEFFINNDTLGVVSDREYISRMHFSHAKGNPRKITLELIHTEKVYKGKGIGGNMLKLLHLFCINANIDLVIGKIIPFDHKTTNIEQVKSFYDKEHFSVLTKKVNSYEAASGDKLKLALTQSLKQQTKHRIITIPASSRNYITLFNPSQIFSSSVQGNQMQ